MGRLFCLILFLLGGSVLATTTTTASTEGCKEKGPPYYCRDAGALLGGWELGIDLQEVFPTDYENFGNSLLTYGFGLGIPLGLNHAIELRGAFGGRSQFEYRLAELGYRYILSAGIFNWVMKAGVFYLHYKTLNIDRIPLLSYDDWGLSAGLGSIIPMASNFSVTFLAKAFYQRRIMLGFGMGFKIHL